MGFKDWLIKNEGLQEPSYVERPDENLRRDAREGRAGGLPTYSNNDLPPTKKNRTKLANKN